VTILNVLRDKKLKLPDIVLKYRSVQKLMSTYYGPFLHQAAIQGSVYPKMHMVSTATGRGSSAAPNGQNMPPAARQCFRSKHGNFIDVDFSQLEICALAVITQDPILIADLMAGTDLHFQTGKDVMGWKVPNDMTSETRRVVKAVNFGLIYGGGAGGLSISTGQPKKLVKQLIGAFFRRYKRVEEWQSEFYKEVVHNMVPAGIIEGEQTYCSNVRLPISNRLFHFREGKSPPWLRAKTGRKFSFKPTETKNYPVQGFAGGDVVMDALVYLYNRTARFPNTTIRMTVHDSLLLDTDLAERDVRAIMNDVCRAIEIKYGLPFQLCFDIKSGKYWQ
jgi:DNA polymerase-1